MGRKKNYWICSVDDFNEWNGDLETTDLVSSGYGKDPQDAVYAYICKHYNLKKKHWDDDEEAYIISDSLNGNRAISYGGCDRIPRSHYLVLRKYFREAKEI
jgi:hypothetical protein